MTSVLIVDNDLPFAETLERAAESFGYDAYAVDSAEAALDFLSEMKIDVMITDLGMQKTDGAAFIRAARAVSPETHTVGMSRFPTAEDYKAATHAGAVDVLTKPFQPSALEAAIKKALDCGTGVQGSIHGLALSDLLLAYGLAKRSVTIRVGDQASIIMKDGEIEHIVDRGVVGVAALKSILRAEGKAVETGPYRPATRTVYEPLDVLLGDAMRARDTGDISGARSTADVSLGASRPPTSGAAPTGAQADLNDTAVEAFGVEPVGASDDLRAGRRRRSRAAVFIGAGSAVLAAGVAFFALQPPSTEPHRDSSSLETRPDTRRVSEIHDAPGHGPGAAFGSKGRDDSSAVMPVHVRIQTRPTGLELINNSTQASLGTSPVTIQVREDGEPLFVRARIGDLTSEALRISAAAPEVELDLTEWSARVSRKAEEVARPAAASAARVAADSPSPEKARAAVAPRPQTRNAQRQAAKSRAQAVAATRAQREAPDKPAADSTPAREGPETVAPPEKRPASNVVSAPSIGLVDDARAPVGLIDDETPQVGVISD